jgi:hypothetical protein
VRATIVLGVALLAALVISAGARTTTHARAADCSAATAKQLVNQYQLNYFLLPDPVAQVLCGSFTGPGSQAMAVAVRAPTCWGTQNWAVFSFDGSAWQLVLSQSRFIFALVAVGSDIRERSPVFRAGDPRCLPSGGSHWRLWHWDGSKLVAGPWSKPSGGQNKSKSGGFRTPSGNIYCNYYGFGGYPPFLFCSIRSGIKPPPPRKGPGCTRAFWTVLHGTGRAAWGGSTCPGHDAPEGPHRELAKKVLRYGQSWSWNGMHCKSAFAGLTCRNKSGRGFFMSRTRTRLL